MISNLMEVFSLILGEENRIWNTCILRSVSDKLCWKRLETMQLDVILSAIKDCCIQFICYRVIKNLVIFWNVLFFNFDYQTTLSKNKFMYVIRVRYHYKE